MQKYLIRLGFTTKEVSVYLALLELGNQPAANVAKKIGIPKSTALFILENLTKEGYVQKSKRGISQYFFADPQDLIEVKKWQHEQESQTLNEVVPLLEEFKTPFSYKPKVTFYEGVSGCQKVYLQLLESKTEILELGIHKDLEEKLGKSFMDNFIIQRCKRNIFLRAISSDNPVDKALQKLDKQQQRMQKFLPANADTYSSIAIWENKVLLLNLHSDAFGILIENEEVCRTLKTLFEVLYGYLPEGKI